MLYLTLVVTGVVLVIANWHPPQPGSWRGLRTLGLTFLASIPLSCIVVSPAVFLEIPCLCLVWLACRLLAIPPKIYRLGTITVALAVLGMMGFFEWQFLSDARQEYAFASMEDRIQPPQASERNQSLKPAALEGLQHLDAEIVNWRHGRRELALKKLHEETIKVFVNSPGFGPARMGPGARLRVGTSRYPDEPVSQPVARDTSAGADVETDSQILANTQAALDKFHRENVLDFVFPEGFGYARSRKQVAGFVPHQFSNLPNNPWPWKLQSLDLIGLVMHKEPVVYLSAHLPRMDELKSAPTRALTEFESAGLDVLRKGEDVYLRETSSSLRMLGAVRAAEKCTECHGCDRGDLLGAFSYTLATAK